MFHLPSLPRATLTAVPGARYASQFTDASSALRSAALSISARDQKPMVRRPRAPGPRRETRTPRRTGSETGAWQQRPPGTLRPRLHGEPRSHPRTPQQRSEPAQDKVSGVEPELVKQASNINFHGDELLFEGQEPPEGYAFFRRDRFLIRHTRSLARERNQKTYMLITGKKHEQGYYVPADILEQVQSRSKELHAKDRQRWWANLENHYPQMPAEDKAAIDKLCYSTFLARTARSPQFYYNHTIRLYVLDRYTDVKLRPPFAEDEEVIGKAHAKADQILIDWMRGSSGPPGQEPVAEE